jgi:hypothetical protein
VDVRGGILGRRHHLFGDIVEQIDQLLLMLRLAGGPVRGVCTRAPALITALAGPRSSPWLFTCGFPVHGHPAGRLGRAPWCLIRSHSG